MNKGIKLGDRVTWTSQAAGATKTKTGIIIGVVKAGSRPDRVKFKQLCKNGIGWSRNHESYVVSVDVGKREKGVSFRQYWPRVSALKKVKL